MLAIAFCGGASTRPPRPPRRSGRPSGHGGRAPGLPPDLHGQPVLYAGQDRYAAYDLLGADTHVPLVEFPDEKVSQRRKAFRHRRRLQPDRLRLLQPRHPRPLPLRGHQPGRLEQRTAAELQARSPRPTFVLWERTGEVPKNRHVLLEGTEPGRSGVRRAGDPRPPLRTGPRLRLPRRRDRPQDRLGQRQRPRHRRETSQTLDLRRALEALDAVLLPGRADPRAPGFCGPDAGPRRPAAEHDQPRQQRPVLARRQIQEKEAGRWSSRCAADASTLQS